MKLKVFTLVLGIITVLVVCVLVLRADAPPSNEDLSWEDPDEQAPPPDSEVPLNDKTYFKVDYRPDVLEPHRWRVRLQLPPPDWPGAVQARVYTQIAVRDVETPSSSVDWSLPFWKVDRHRKRNDRAESFIWDMLKNAELQWIEYPTPSPDGSYVYCDVYAQWGDKVINYADLLVDSGNGMPDIGIPYDWGAPEVRVKR